MKKADSRDFRGERIQSESPRKLELDMPDVVWHCKRAMDARWNRL